MEITELAVPGAFVVRPAVRRDDRGEFAELYRFDLLAQVVGHPLTLAQVNSSRSRRGTLRGIHFADVPPGQAKYVSCAHGSVLDVVVDIRTGSPSFGQWTSVQLDATERTALYVSEGLGHAFVALTEDAVVTYLCSTTYNPAAEHGIDPLDPAIGITWPGDVEPLLSPKDLAAPSLQQALDDGLLPAWDDCQKLYRSRAEGAA